MQRLARIALTQENRKAIDLFEQFKEIKAFLIHYLPPSTLQVFAEPVVKGDIVEWYSNLEGQPIRLSDKHLDSKLSVSVQNKLASISNLVAELQNKNQISLQKAQSIYHLLAAVNYSKKEIYTVNDEPVIVGWGVGDPLPAPVVESVKGTSVFFTKHRCCLWLFPLLLLLLGLLAWWWFYIRQPEPVKLLSEPLKTEESLKKEELKPELPKVEEPSTIIEQPLKPKEQTKVEEPIKVEEEPKTVEPAKTEGIKNEKKEEPVKPVIQCTKTVVPEKRPQMVIIFDNSISMLYSLAETEASIDDFYARQARGIGVTEAEWNHLTREPRRLTVAKSSTSNIIDKIDRNIDIGLISLNHCPHATSSGFYGPTKRSALKKKINGMYPDEFHQIGGTPLYSGLRQAASMVNGVDREAFILLVSDGEDTCEQGNVCQLAKELAKTKPKLKINVVDIGNKKAANCVAKSTGGKVFTANSRTQVISMINQAVKPMIEKEECK